MTIPNHVAIILDGNRRWAKSRNLPTLEGHRKGVDAFLDIGKKSRELGIRILTGWCFSTENWDRSKEEVSYLMKIFEATIDRYLNDALKEEVRILHIGRKDRIPESLKTKIKYAEEETAHFKKYYMVFALDYGGRDDILRAINKLVKVNEDITESTIDAYLDTRDLPYPNPDLIIRTGGEVRTSGFMSWQSAYSEYIFLPQPLPDLTPDLFAACIDEYSQRQRRFGK